METIAKLNKGYDCSCGITRCSYGGKCWNKGDRYCKMYGPMWYIDEPTKSCTCGRKEKGEKCAWDRENCSGLPPEPPSPPAFPTLPPPPSPELEFVDEP